MFGMLSGSFPPYVKSCAKVRTLNLDTPWFSFSWLSGNILNALFMPWCQIKSLGAFQGQERGMIFVF